MHREDPIIFGKQQLLGIIHTPEPSSETSSEKKQTTGVVIVVGGPQYRIGSHRQFLKLSRFLAQQNIASLRFDCAGMGDSGGKFESFMDIDSSIEQAIDTLMENRPQLEDIVLWGLCDAATAITKYCTNDPRVSGLFLLNPWVKDEQLAAESLVKNHYKKQLLSLEFWKRVFTGKVKIFSAATDFAKSLLAMKKDSGNEKGPSSEKSSQPNLASSLQQMMLQQLQNFAGKVEILLSENDLTAQEFTTATANPNWQKLISEKPIQITTIAGANHTFASEKLRSQVQEITEKFVSANYKNIHL